MLVAHSSMILLGFGVGYYLGAANCCLLALLADRVAATTRTPGTGTFTRRIAQGAAMGRPSLLLGTCKYDENGVPIAVHIAGKAVQIMSGSIRRAPFESAAAVGDS